VHAAAMKMQEIATGRHLERPGLGSACIIAVIF